MKKLFLTLSVVFMFISSCDLIPKKPGSGNEAAIEKERLEQNKYGLSNNEQFNAIAFGYMTLSQVADTNNISLNFLKQELGIPDYIKQDYKIEQIGKNYKFNANDVKKIINDQKNKETAKQKKQQTKNN